MKSTTKVFGKLLESGWRGVFAASLLIVLASVGPAFAQAPAWTQLSPSGGSPVANLQMGTAFDSTTHDMIIFGGIVGTNLSGVPPLSNDVWVLTNSDGVNGTPTWTQLSPTGTPPSPRSAAGSAVYDPNTNSLIVFAGNPNVGNSCGTVNDLWLLSHANGQGGTPQWTQLTPNGGPPPSRTSHSAVYDAASNRMIVFDGTGFCGSNFDDVWVLTNANNTGGVPTWFQLSPAGGPPASRAGHIAVYDSTTNRMTIFGGYGVPNDVWVLENANGLGGTPTWTQLTPAGNLPAPRGNLGAIYDPSTNQMTIFGGDASTGLANDVWVLSNANGLGGTPGWTQLTPTGGPPAPRREHSAVFNPSSNRMTIFGGFTNFPSCCSALHDTWVLTDANGIAISGLIDVVNSFSLPSGTANSLLAKLGNAQASVAAGNLTAGCNELKAFIHEVQAQLGKKVTVDQANELVTFANGLRATLGCP